MGGGAAAASEAAAAGAGGISAAGMTAVTGGLAAVIGGLVIAGRKGYLPGTEAYVERKLREQEKLYSPENIAKIASIPATFERRKSWWENAWEFIKTPPLTYMKNRLTVELEGRRRELVPPPAPPKPPWKVEVTAAPTFQIQTAANAEEVLSIVRANFQDLADEIQERIAQTLMQSSNNRQTLNFFNRPVILPE